MAKYSVVEHHFDFRTGGKMWTVAIPPPATSWPKIRSELARRRRMGEMADTLSHWVVTGSCPEHKIIGQFALQLWKRQMEGDAT